MPGNANATDDHTPFLSSNVHADQQKEVAFVTTDSWLHVGPIMKKQQQISRNTRQPLETSAEPGACFFGQLTDKGRQSLFSLGSFMRRLYIDEYKLLPETFDEATEKVTFFRTTDYPRTVESIQYLIGGLYPIKKRNRVPTVHFKLFDDETLYANGRCKRYEQLMRQFQDAYKSSSQEYKKYQDDFAHYTSHPSRPSLYALYDTFIARRAHNMSLPDDITDEALYKLERHSMFYWFDPFHQSRELTRLGIGRFLDEVCTQMKDAAQGTSPIKLAIYSVGPVIASLDAFDSRWPPFASNVTFELFEKQDESLKEDDFTKHYVRVRYNAKILPLPFCSKRHDEDKTMCRLDAFLEEMKKFTPADYEKECAAV